MSFPNVRLRRLRRTENLRRMMREYRLSVDDLVMPFFVRAGIDEPVPVDSMPGVFQLPVEALVGECRRARDAGIPAVILFGIPAEKDMEATSALRDDGVVQTALRAIKDAVDDLVVITDVCLCAYTDHGHCGMVRDNGEVDNDATLEVMAAQALSHARAGADMVAPSDMMDGRVGRIRRALDESGFRDVCIMAYSAKFASAFYGPFREAADSTPLVGDRRGYQMDFNADEAMREVALDIEEGADIVMVKPALAYLDVVRRVKETFGVPLALYNVSGEYAMVKAAADRGWIDERRVRLEMLHAFKRAGADIILTYWAMEMARELTG
jgi:porphobilinogen synthase